MNKKLLIGSCGGLTGYYLIKHFNKIWPKLTIYGIDSGLVNPSRLFVDTFIQVNPADKEESFIKDIINIINLNAIDFYLPTHSVECRLVSKYIEKIRSSTNIKILISPYAAYATLDNKANAYSELKQIGVCVPQVYTKGEKPVFPLLAKPILSSGSKGIKLITNEEELDLVLKRGNYIIMEYLRGVEYTADILFDHRSNVFTYNQRKRVKVLGGAAVISENDFSCECLNDISAIGKAFKIKGPANMQFFLTENNSTIFFDINLRFASGGLPLSVESGADIPVALVRLLNGDTVNPDEFKSDRKPRRMYRCFEEFYEEINYI